MKLQFADMFGVDSSKRLVELYEDGIYASMPRAKMLKTITSEGYAISLLLKRDKCVEAFDGYLEVRY